MRMTVIAAMLAMTAAFTMPAHAAMSADDCKGMWMKADADGDGQLSDKEATPYLEAIKMAKMETKDSMMVTGDEFMKACESGAFDKMNM